ncbi:MAG: hypothetical protein ACLUN0_09835 [Roseburia sp.]
MIIEEQLLRREGRKFYEYKDGEWVRRGLGIGYFLPDAPEFECYEEITEEEALKRNRRNEVDTTSL